jgi:mRNA-degrading endonuclease RelE of RelBE toxin-antitoxin system
VFSFIETKLFTKLVVEYLSDERYSELQAELISNPSIGAVIRGSGGVRKVRWAAAGRGKSGGYRIVYYV